MNKPSADNSSGMFVVSIDGQLFHRTGVEREAMAYSRSLYFSCLSYLSFRSTGVHLQHRELVYQPVIEEFISGKIKSISEMSKPRGRCTVTLHGKKVTSDNIMELWENCYKLL